MKDMDKEWKRIERRVTDLEESVAKVSKGTPSLKKSFFRLVKKNADDRNDLSSEISNLWLTLDERDGWKDITFKREDAMAILERVIALIENVFDAFSTIEDLQFIEILRSKGIIVDLEDLDQFLGRPVSTP